MGLNPKLEQRFGTFQFLMPDTARLFSTLLILELEQLIKWILHEQEHNKEEDKHKSLKQVNQHTSGI